MNCRVQKSSPGRFSRSVADSLDVDEADRVLVDRIQQGVPLVCRPYDAIAREVECSAADVRARVRFLRETRGLIREISGIFDVGAMGFEQALVCFRVSDSDIDRAGDVVAAHPGVSHCYGRTGTRNLWFTLATSPDSSLGFDRTVQCLAGQAGASDWLILPTLRRYKLSTRFMMGGNDAAVSLEETSNRSRGAPAVPGQLSAEVKQVVRALQTDLPAEESPFYGLAEQGGMTVRQLLDVARDLRETGRMRRYAAVLNHRLAGASANVMVVWQVPEQRTDEAGQLCAENRAVSHCYLRPPGRDWPYTLYTMVHGASAGACEATVAEMSKRIGIDQYRLLWTMQEYAKRRVRLFDGSEQLWERNNAQESPGSRGGGG